MFFAKVPSELSKVLPHYRDRASRKFFPKGGWFRGQRGVDSSRKGPDPLTPTLDPRMGAHRKQVELYTL